MSKPKGLKKIKLSSQGSMTLKFFSIIADHYKVKISILLCYADKVMAEKDDDNHSNSFIRRRKIYLKLVLNNFLRRAKLKIFTLSKSTFTRVSFHKLRTTVPFATAHPEIFHCTHHPVIPDSDLYFPFCSIFNVLSKSNC